MEVQIREIKEDDILNCLELLEQLTETGRDFDYLSVFYKIKNNSYFIYIAEIGNRIVGIATLLIEQKFIHKGGRVAHLEDVVIDKDFRGLGIGKILVEECVKFAENKQCYKIILDCNEENIGFYEKCRFKKYGVAMKIVF